MPEGEAGERRVAAGAAAGDAEAFRVNQALFGQVLGRVAAVIHVHHAPAARRQTRLHTASKLAEYDTAMLQARSHTFGRAPAGSGCLITPQTCAFLTAASADVAVLHICLGQET